MGGAARPLSVSLGAAPGVCEEDEALELAAAVRARFLGGMTCDVWGGNEGTVVAVGAVESCGKKTNDGTC